MGALATAAINRAWRSKEITGETGHRTVHITTCRLALAVTGLARG